MLGSEGDINGLAGYGGSLPVRIGNAAANQVQLDVFAPIVDLVAMLAERGAPVSPDHWRLVRSMMQAVAARWMEPDHGIWEIRGPKQHHVHSRVMCWHAISRGLAVEEFVTGSRTGMFEQLCGEIAADVLRSGWNEEVGAFTIAYGERALDAAALTVGLTGLLPADDPRFVSTVEKVGTGLRGGYGLYRYRMEDGLAGDEGTFLLCSAWYIEALVMIGRVAEAREWFERYVGLAGPTGLLAEEHDPQLDVALGNYPQAYSHLGLINCAVVLAAAGERD
jgi:GH15 family glucan-1,4-alpha-glucosidase